MSQGMFGNIALADLNARASKLPNPWLLMRPLLVRESVASSGIENINIEIKGARHNDFVYDPTIWNTNPFPAEARVKEINRQTNLFMRNLYKAVVDDQATPGALRGFLDSLVANGTARLENGVWKIDFGVV